MKCSIIITAYNSQDFIEECLDSIANQTIWKKRDCKYEILLGIDHCEKTLEKVNSIKYKYPNLKVFWMTENVGTYIVRNTLSEIAKNKVLVFFDSDDIMEKRMLEITLKYSNLYEIVNFGFLNFTVDPPREWKINMPYAHGVQQIRKETFDRYGGYKSWRCSADSDFLFRTHEANRKIIRQPLFKRRKHSGALTECPETGLKSKIREYYRTILYKKGDLQFIEKVTRPYERIIY